MRKARIPAAGNRFRRAAISYLTEKGILNQVYKGRNKFLINVLNTYFPGMPRTRREQYLFFLEKLPKTRCLYGVPPLSEDFYRSDAWFTVRYEALKRGKGCCECCGARATANNPLHVDHIKPRSYHPELELDLSNLQVLCRECNLGKRNYDDTDWRDNVIELQRFKTTG
jgi:hypothetical protein